MQKGYIAIGLSRREPERESNGAGTGAREEKDKRARVTVTGYPYKHPHIAALWPITTQDAPLRACVCVPAIEVLFIERSTGGARLTSRVQRACGLNVLRMRHSARGKLGTAVYLGLCIGIVFWGFYSSGYNSTAVSANVGMHTKWYLIHYVFIARFFKVLKLILIQ